MKNRIKLVFITVFAAAAVFLLASCGEKGGTFVIKNETGEVIYGYAISGYYTEPQINELIQDENSVVLAKAIKTIYDGETGEWPFSSNINVTWCWRFPSRNIEYGGIEKLEKGNDVTVTARQ